MKKAEAISILATSVRPREAKDRARYDEAVKMAIEALKCSETPKSSERTSETAQADHVADIGKKVSISKVIRCKGCKFAHITNDGRYCKYCDMFTDDYGQLIEMYFDSNFYCGYAERRTDGQSKSD